MLVRMREEMLLGVRPPDARVYTVVMVIYVILIECKTVNKNLHGFMTEM